MELAGFDASMQEEWRPSGGPLPEGEYVAVIDQSEEKTNSKGTGSYLELRFEIIEGEHSSRKLWTRLNLNNPSEKAVQIAKAELGAICKAVGVITPNVTEDLHDRPLVIKVRTEKDNKGNDRNVIKGYTARNGAVPPNVKVPESAQKKAKPWQKTGNTWQPKQETPF